MHTADKVLTPGLTLLFYRYRLTFQGYFQAPVNLRTDGKSLVEALAPLGGGGGGSGGMLPREILKNQMR